MYIPSLFRNDIPDELITVSIHTTRTDDSCFAMMKVDIKDTGDGYQIELDLPGFSREELSAQLKNGYLTISASHTLNTEETPKISGNEHYLCRERYSGSYVRSFYVGDTLQQSEIRARFENGVLILTYPKKHAPQIEDHRISIEG